MATHGGVRRRKNKGGGDRGGDETNRAYDIDADALDDSSGSDSDTAGAAPAAVSSTPSSKAADGTGRKAKAKAAPAAPARGEPLARSEFEGGAVWDEDGKLYVADKGMLAGPARLATIGGLLALVLFVVMGSKAGGSISAYTHPNAAGFRTATLWVQLAESKEEVLQALGPEDSAAGQKLRRRMVVQCNWDFAYIAGYTFHQVSIAVLLFVLLRNRGPKNRRGYPYGLKGLKATLWMCFTAALSDVLETYQMRTLAVGSSGALTVQDAISGTTSPALTETRVEIIRMLARIKYISLFLVCAFFAAAYGKYMAPVPKRLMAIPLYLGSKETVPPTAYIFTAVMGTAAVAVPQLRSMVEGASLLLGVAWVASFCHAAFLSWQCLVAQKALRPTPKADGGDSNGGNGARNQRAKGAATKGKGQGQASRGRGARSS